MRDADVLLMLTGVARPCPDCADERVFMPADDGEAPGAFCCTDCGAALLIDVEVETRADDRGRPTRVA
jgi:hypothetical protein